MLCDLSSPPLPDAPAQHDVATLQPGHTHRCNAAVPLHWVSTAAAFSSSGGLVSGDALAELIHQRCGMAGGLPETETVALVARWITIRAVVSLRSPWGPLYPLFQFDLSTASVVEAMVPLLDELRPVFEDAELALWFVTPNDWLGGAQPASAMHQSLPAVLQAARADRFVAGGY